MIETNTRRIQCLGATVCSNISISVLENFTGVPLPSSAKGKAESHCVLGTADERRSGFHPLCPRYSGTPTPTAPMAVRPWQTFTFNLLLPSSCNPLLHGIGPNTSETTLNPQFFIHTQYGSQGEESVIIFLSDVYNLSLNPSLLPHARLP